MIAITDYSRNKVILGEKIILKLLLIGVLNINTSILHKISTHTGIYIIKERKKEG